MSSSSWPGWLPSARLPNDHRVLPAVRVAVIGSRATAGEAEGQVEQAWGLLPNTPWHVAISPFWHADARPAPGSCRRLSGIGRRKECLEGLRRSWRAAFHVARLLVPIPRVR